MDFVIMPKDVQLSETFIQPAEFDRLTARIAEIVPDPLVGKVTQDQVKRALQLYGNIWPGRARNPFDP